MLRYLMICGKASSPEAVAGSTRWGLRVEAVDSFEGGFVGVH